MTSAAPTPTGMPLLVVAGIARRGDEVLLAQRPAGSHLAGLWEFPGGKVAPGEDPDDALRREWLEELGCDLAGAEPWLFAHHRYEARRVLLLFYLVEPAGEPVPQEGQRLAWVAREELAAWPLPAADAALVAALAAGADRGEFQVSG